MKRITIITLSVALVAVLIISALPVLAAKPPSVITVSNGFPSGMHFNLNIHGKNPETFTTPLKPQGGYPPPYGKSIFIPEYTDDYGPITIEVISDKKKVGILEVIDPYAMPTLLAGDPPTIPTGFENADDLAQFNLPYKILTDDGVINTNGYYVYGRILGKPNNSREPDAPSNIILTPSPILQIDQNGATFPLGMVTTKGAYAVGSSGTFERFDDTPAPTNGKGKGKSTAKNITDMFMWTGWAVDISLDTNIQSDGIPDGVIDENDVPADQDGDTDIDSVDLQLWLEAMEVAGFARYYEEWWVFDIAEMVTHSWDVDNDGTKLLQIRFYPVATTTFTEKAHIVVNKVTDPLGDTTTLFDFEASYRSDFQMTSDQFSLSHALEEGDYSVTELAEDGWDLTDISIEDPTGGSTYDVEGGTADIDLALGETVTITFTNTQRGQIIVDKVTVLPNEQLFDFALTGGPEAINQAFQLADATTPYQSGLIRPGTYSVAETVPSGWDLTNAVCSDGSPVDAIILDPGETVTVTFTNELQIQ